MNKLSAIRRLERIRRQQKQASPYLDNPKDWEYLDFITVYYRQGALTNNLVWCNTVNEALEELRKLDNHQIALEIGDVFKE
jgi:hypothetical protein